MAGYDRRSAERRAKKESSECAEERCFFMGLRKTKALECGVPEQDVCGKSGFAAGIFRT